MHPAHGRATKPAHPTCPVSRDLLDLVIAASAAIVLQLRAVMVMAAISGRPNYCRTAESRPQYRPLGPPRRCNHPAAQGPSRRPKPVRCLARWPRPYPARHRRRPWSARFHPPWRSARSGRIVDGGRKSFRCAFSTLRKSPAHDREYQGRNLTGICGFVAQMQTAFSFFCQRQPRFRKLLPAKAPYHDGNR